MQVPSSMAGQTVSVQIFDAPFYPSNPSPATLVPPDSWGGTGLTSSFGGFTTTYTMYNATRSDSLNLAATNKMTTANCGTFGGTQAYAYTTTATTATNAWSTICKFQVPSMTGAYDVYPLVVSNGTSGVGENEYSLRACVLASSGTPPPCAAGSYAAGTQPEVYAINNMSIWSGQAGTSVVRPRSGQHQQQLRRPHARDRHVRPG